jgi:sugar lactone lactonase YvrE
MRRTACALLLVVAAACGPSGSVRTLAGSTEPGFADGVGADARFRSPAGIAVASDGTVFVADSEANAIRRVTLGGEVSTLVSSTATGLTDGPPGVATLFLPISLAIDVDGSLLVGEGGNRALRAIDPSTGEVTTITGGGDGYVDGPLASARFGPIAGIAIDAATGVIFLTDAGNHAVRRIDRAAATVATVAGNGSPGSVDGAGAAARFDGPVGIAFDGNALWVADSRNHTIRRIDGAGVVTTVAGEPGAAGYREGVGRGARFQRPWGVAWRGSELYVADSWNHVVRSVSLDGSTRRLAGMPSMPSPQPIGTDGSVDAATFRSPSHVVGWNGLVLVSETARIREIDP